MTRRKQPQRSLWEGILAEDVKALWEPWMVEADKLLEDDELIERVYEAQGDRHAYSRTRGRSQTPAEVALRLLLLAAEGRGAGSEDAGRHDGGGDQHPLPHGLGAAGRRGSSAHAHDEENREAGGKAQAQIEGSHA